MGLDACVCYWKRFVSERQIILKDFQSKLGSTYYNDYESTNVVQNWF